jgi:hypothetical protein
MKKIVTALVFMAIVGTTGSAFAQQISEHRAQAIQRCQAYADGKWGPSGVRDWRRYNHDTYAECMFDSGEPE